MWIPGRLAAVIDFSASSLGAAFGVGLGALLARRMSVTGTGRRRIKARVVPSRPNQGEAAFPKGLPERLLHLNNPAAEP
jgi:hypothetical protein